MNFRYFLTGVYSLLVIDVNECLPTKHGIFILCSAGVFDNKELSGSERIQ